MDLLLQACSSIFHLDTSHPPIYVAALRLKVESATPITARPLVPATFLCAVSCASVLREDVTLRVRRCTAHEPSLPYSPFFVGGVTPTLLHYCAVDKTLVGGLGELCS